MRVLSWIFGLDWNWKKSLKLSFKILFRSADCVGAVWAPFVDSYVIPLMILFAVAEVAGLTSSISISNVLLVTEILKSSFFAVWFGFISILSPSDIVIRWAPVTNSFLIKDCPSA